MPEVAEVAHAVAQLRRNIVGYKIKRVSLQHDPLLFPILKNSNDPEKELNRIEKLLTGSTVQKVGRHGKYFWIRFDKNLIMLMHFGMTGMVKLRDIPSHHIFMENGGDKRVFEEGDKPKGDKQKKGKLKDDEKDGRKSKYFKVEEVENVETTVEVQEEWPPRFSKLEMILSNSSTIDNVDLSFVDPRRLGRIRLLENIQTDEQLFEIEPMSRQGPDYSKCHLESSKKGKVKVDKEFVFGDPDPQVYIPPLTFPEFCTLVLSKKKQIKSLLLEQEYFAGIGNWVGDEVLYQSRIHPTEVLRDKLNESSPVLEALYNSIKNVCTYAVKVEGNVKEFPDDWLMLHRWGKRRSKQEKPKVGGHVIDFVTVGGRTSCFVPHVQKKLKQDK